MESILNKLNISTQIPSEYYTKTVSVNEFFEKFSGDPQLSYMGRTDVNPYVLSLPNNTLFNVQLVSLKDVTFDGITVSETDEKNTYTLDINTNAPAVVMLFAPTNNVKTFTLGFTDPKHKLPKAIEGGNAVEMLYRDDTSPNIVLIFIKSYDIGTVEIYAEPQPSIWCNLFGLFCD